MDFVKDWMKAADKRDKQKSKLLADIKIKPDIVNLLKKYDREPSHIDDIYELLLTSVAGENLASSVVKNPKLLEHYLRMESEGKKSPEIAYALVRLRRSN